MGRTVALCDSQQEQVARATVQRWLWLAMDAWVRLVLYNLRAVSAMQRIPATPALQRWRRFIACAREEHYQKTVANLLPQYYPKTIRRVQTSNRGRWAVQHGSDKDILTERRAHERRILWAWVGFSPHASGAESE